MKEVLRTIDRAADTLYEGFVSHALGWRGAVLFFVLLAGLVPLASLVNALCSGLALLVILRPTDVNLSVGEFYSVCAGLLLTGAIGLWMDIKKMAERPAVDRSNPPWKSQ